jgi:hypothetical protein
MYTKIELPINQYESLPINQLLDMIVKQLITQQKLSVMLRVNISNFYYACTEEDLQPDILLAQYLV